MHINVGKDLFYETQSHSIEHIQNGKRQQHHKHSVQYIGSGEGFLFFRRPLTNSQYNHIPESKNRNMHPAKSLKPLTDPAPFLKFLDLFFLFIRFLHLFRRLVYSCLLISGCMACGACAETGKCVIDDIVNEIAPKFEKADGLVVGSPVYYASANATLVACLTRLFYSTHFDKRMKVGASVVSARRGGCSASFDELNKFFTISGMPVASSQYWNSIHGNNADEAKQDGEGLQIMRTLANNMAFLIKSIAMGKEMFGLPELEERIGTNFIR